MRFSNRWSFKAIIVALFSLVFCACNMTPQQRFNADTLAWKGLKKSVVAYTAANPVTQAQADIITANFRQGDQNLADAADWLAKNPTLATVPGDGPPSLNALFIAISALDATIPDKITVKVK